MASRSDRGLQFWVALVGVAGALLGAAIGGAVAITVQRDQRNEDRQAEARAKRGEVYARFLDSSDQWGVAVDRLFEVCPKQFRASRRAGRKPTCSVYKSFVSARANFQRSLNEVYVYGSDQAYAAAKRVAALLPSAGDTRLHKLEIAPVKALAFARAWIGFQRVMCREANAQPRARC